MSKIKFRPTREKAPELVNLELELTPRGIAVLGNTFPVKDLLREEGARWNPDIKAWVFAVDCDLIKKKDSLLETLNSSELVGDVLDTVKAEISVVACKRGFVVQGNTYPLKDFLKAQHGARWEADLKAWSFPDELKSEVLKALTESGAVSLAKAQQLATLQVAKVLSTPEAKMARRQESTGDDYNNMSAAKLKEKLKAIGCTTGGGKEAFIERLRTVETAKAESNKPAPQASAIAKWAAEKRASTMQLAVPQKPGMKIVETGKRTNCTEERADGSRVSTQTDKKQRLTCKTGGALEECKSMTTKRKLEQKSDRIVETIVTTIKRTRMK